MTIDMRDHLAPLGLDYDRVIAVERASNYARQIAAEAISFRQRCGLPQLADVVQQPLGVDLVIKRDPRFDLFGLRVQVYGDVNDPGSVDVSLYTDAGERLQQIRLTTVEITVAWACVVALVNQAQGTLA